MSKQLTVYIPTCDPNIFVLKYFQYFFNKYWDGNMKVKVLGFRNQDFDLYDNFEFISLDSSQKGGASGWSNYMIDYFTSIDDEKFIFGIEDFAVARPVDQLALETCLSSLDNDVGRVDLQCSLQFARHPLEVNPYGSKNGIELLELKQNGSYRIAGAFSAWNKSWFLKNMMRDWSPWDWEIKGSYLSINDGFKVLGTKDRWAIKKIEMISDKAWPGVINTHGLRSSDVEEMKKMSSRFDRVTEMREVTGEQWGYHEYCGPNWLKIIYGD
jgi:hypothetical protein